MGRVPSDTRKEATMQVRLSCTVMLTLDRADVNHLEEASLFHERWVTLGMDLQLMPVCALRPQAARLAQPHLAQQQRQLQPSDGLHPAPRPHPPLPPPKRLLRPVIGRRSPPIPKCNPIAQPALGYPSRNCLNRYSALCSLARGWKRAGRRRASSSSCFPPLGAAPAGPRPPAQGAAGTRAPAPAGTAAALAPPAGGEERHRGGVSAPPPLSRPQSSPAQRSPPRPPQTAPCARSATW